MKTAKGKILKILFVVGLIFGISGIGSVTQVYSAAVSETLTDQPLIQVNLQSPIDGTVLLPYFEFSLSANHGPSGAISSTTPMPTQNNFVFFYRCLDDSTGTPPAPSMINTSGTATLRPPGNMAKAGYVFIGWRNGNHIFRPWQTFRLTGNDYHFYFYAVWAPAVLLTLDANGGALATQSIRRGAGTQMRTMPPQPTKEGYIFLGWFTTPDATAGSRLTPFTTVPNTETTYWARWSVPISVTVYYENLVNRNTADARNLADSNINEIRGLFMTTFGIDLIQRPNTTRYSPALNQAGFTASDILDINPSNASTVIFRFVDIPLNESRIAGLARQVRGQEGTAQMHLGDMVVTTELAPAMLRRAIVHEISHVFGAHDCSSWGCVMDISRSHTIYNRWCATCRSDINNYLYNRRRLNPGL